MRVRRRAARKESALEDFVPIEEEVVAEPAPSCADQSVPKKAERQREGLSVVASNLQRQRVRD